MGENTGILWAGRPLPDGTIEPGYTFNPWIGCQKVSPGCLNCYAETYANRYGWVSEWGKDYHLTADANWKKPIQWARQAVRDVVIRRVFCASLADVFDENVNKEWRARLFDLILDTEEIGGLEWLLLTKRPENIGYMFEYMSEATNVRIGVTCENQEMADKRIVELFKNWQGKNLISVEPMLSEVKLKQSWIDYLDGWYTDTWVDRLTGEPEPMQAPMPKIDWVICGCESGSSARPCNLDWVSDLRDQCVASGTPFFLKQLNINGQLVKEPEIDGRQWLEFPKAG